VACKDAAEENVMAEHKGAKVVLVTCGKLAEARKIARSVVELELAACVNIISAPVESVFRWKGRVERAKEFLLIIKTTRRRLALLERRIAALHSYEVPEFLVLKVDGGSPRYLRWLADNT
jgi:periplasmic divalent cation tolerance protein